MQKSLFISYSRADMTETDWCRRLRMYLAPLQRAGTVDTWDDSRIETGADWRAEIDKALKRAAAAVLLVGPGLLASDFVMQYELPILLEAASQRGTTVFPVIVGYCGYAATKLEKYQAVNDPNRPLESLARAEQNKILNEVAILVDRALRTAPNTLATPDATLPHVKRDAISEIARKLDDTHTAFVAQCSRRDGLVDMLERRLRIHNDLEYEKFFFKYFPELTDAERFEFDQIRAMTEGPLFNGNRRIVELLEKFPDIADDIPELMALRQHLVFWLNKFDRIFSKNKAMCLLYTGVEDGVPFPSYVNDVIVEWLRKQ
jgi:hypothetical protein